jgi:hypothetical protein
MASVFEELFEDRPLSLPLSKRQQFIIDAEEAGAISSANQFTLVVRNQQGYVSLADSASRSRGCSRRRAAMRRRRIAPTGPRSGTSARPSCIWTAS